MNPPDRSEDRSQSPIAMLLAIFLACGIIGGALALGYSSRIQNQRIVEMASTCPKLGDAWIADLQAGRFEAVRAASTPNYRAKLTDQELNRIRERVAAIPSPPIASGWTLGSTSQGIALFPPRIISEEPVFTYLVSYPAPIGVPSTKDFALRFDRVDNRYLVDETSIVPRAASPPAPAPASKK